MDDSSVILEVSEMAENDAMKMGDSLNPSLVLEGYKEVKIVQ